MVAEAVVEEEAGNMDKEFFKIMGITLVLALIVGMFTYKKIKEKDANTFEEARIIQEALQSYRSTHVNYPEGLYLLVPNYIDKEPISEFTHWPKFLYEQLKDDYKLCTGYVFEGYQCFSKGGKVPYRS